ncbi:MAG: family 16 glycosylhydrolase [Cytophagaceae bacterium]
MQNKLLLLKGLLLFFVAFVWGNSAFSQCQQLVWSDEFNGTNIDMTKWEFQTGTGTSYGLQPGWGNNERQYYTNNANNARIVDGKLVITARYEPNYLGSGMNYTSARLRSRGKGDWKYGRFEASIKVPEPFWDSKHWPAFWMLPYTNNWPTTGEIDIMETGANGEPWKYFGTIHYNCSPCPAPKNRHTGTGGVNIPAGTGIPNDFDLSKQFHTYRVDWSPGLIEWYVDGVKRGQRVPSDLTSTGALTSDWPFDATGSGNNIHFLLNIAVGGWFPGNEVPNSARYPLSMEVDWVRVYSNVSATQITGKSKVLQGQNAVEYSVAPATGTYTWAVPSGATITSGQGTNKIVVNYGANATSGNVSVTINPGGSCVAATANLPVTVVANTCTVTLDDFEATGQRNLGYAFATGWLNRTNTTSPSDPFGSFANPSATGINTSARVCKYERNPGVTYDVIAYNDFVLGNADHMKAGVMAFNMDVYSAAPQGTQIIIQLENKDLAQTGWPNGIHSRYAATTGAPNTWNRLTFTLLDTPSPNMSGSLVDQIVLLFNPNSNTNHTYFFDNFRRVGATPNTSAITGPNSACSNQTGLNYSVTGFVGSTYTWTVPTGATIVSGQGTNAIVVNMGTTAGSVTVTERSSVNCTGPVRSLSVGLTGTCVLTANFSASTVSTCAGSTVTFTDQSTGKIGGETFSWNFGPGASLPAGTTGAGPHNVTYSTGGTKTVTLTVTRGATSSTETKNNYITVEPPPAGCLFSDDYDNNTVNWLSTGAFTHAESGTVWTISNTGHGEWDNFIYTLNNGTTARAINFTCPLNKPVLKIRARASANCLLRIMLMDGNGNTTDNVPSFNLELTTTYQTFTINYAGRMFNQYTTPGPLDSSNVNRLMFFINPGYVSYPHVGTNRTYNTAFAGTVDVDWIGIGDNCNQFSQPVVSSFTPNCVSQGTSVTITGSNFNGATAVRFNGVNATSFTVNSSTQITAVAPSGVTAGTISVVGPAGTGTSSGSYTVAVTPSVVIALTSGTNPSCVGSSLTFTATPQNGGTSPTYQWRVNTTNVGTNSNTFTSTTITNGQSVSCIMTSNAACVTSATATSNSISITRNNLPTTANAGSNQNITTTSTQLAANTPSSGTGSWSVQSGTGTFNSATNPSATVSGLSSGPNVLRWTITSGDCPPSTSDVTITVGNAPNATITGPSSVNQGETVQYSVASNSGATFNWTVPAGASIINGAGTNVITVVFNSGPGGNVTVQVSSAFGVANDSRNVSVNIPTGVYSTSASYVKVFPNPFSEGLSIDVSEDRTIESLTVQDMNGKIYIDNGKLSDNENLGSELPAGVYLLKVKFSEGREELIKLVKTP